MDLDKLVQRLAAETGDPVAQRIAKRLLDWKADDTTVEQLRESVDRLLAARGTGAPRNDDDVRRLWCAFRDDAVDGIGGMTINERLYWFSLFQRFDESEAEHDRLRIYRKLHASP